jgi:RNA ligase (TIGR02306 family)
VSEFHVETVRLGPIEKHPNADALCITMVHGGYPVITRLGEYQEGDVAVYVPVDAIVPADDPRWEFLGSGRRIKAKKLRGVFSMGLLTPADPSWDEGRDVAAELRIERYEPPQAGEQSEPRAKVPCADDEEDPGFLPTYTDIEGLRKWGKVLVEGEEVILAEKIHGENFRAVFSEGRLWVGSRTRIKKRSETSNWWRAAIDAGLDEKLATVPGIAVYGESHGYTGGFPYGTGRKPSLRVFDAMDIATRRYLDADEFYALAEKLGLATAPVLYRGPWSDALRSHADGQSTLDPSHIREGFVVRPVKERSQFHNLGRVILKLHGEAFLLKAK